jgi:hypothetical protein
MKLYDRRGQKVPVEDMDGLAISGPQFKRRPPLVIMQLDLIVLASDGIGRSEFLNASNLNPLPRKTQFRLTQRFITGFCMA